MLQNLLIFEGRSQDGEKNPRWHIPGIFQISGEGKFWTRGSPQRREKSLQFPEPRRTTRTRSARYPRPLQAAATFPCGREGRGRAQLGAPGLRGASRRGTAPPRPPPPGRGGTAHPAKRPPRLRPPRPPRGAAPASRGAPGGSRRGPARCLTGQRGRPGAAQLTWAQQAPPLAPAARLPPAAICCSRSEGAALSCPPPPAPSPTGPASSQSGKIPRQRTRRLPTALRLRLPRAPLRAPAASCMLISATSGSPPRTRPESAAAGRLGNGDKRGCAFFFFFPLPLY